MPGRQRLCLWSSWKPPRLLLCYLAPLAVYATAACDGRHKFCEFGDGRHRLMGPRGSKIFLPVTCVTGSLAASGLAIAREIHACPAELLPSAAMTRERLRLYALIDRHLRASEIAIDRLHMLNGSNPELHRLASRLRRMALRAQPVEPIGTAINPAKAG